MTATKISVGSVVRCLDMEWIVESMDYGKAWLVRPNENWRTRQLVSDCTLVR